MCWDQAMRLPASCAAPYHLAITHGVLTDAKHWVNLLHLDIALTVIPGPWDFDMERGNSDNDTLCKHSC